MSNIQNSFEHFEKKVEEIDIRKKEWNESVIKTSEKIISIIKILLKHPKIFLAFTELLSKCNNSNLKEWKWVYTDYKFNWSHFPASSLMISTDMSESRNIDFDSKDPEIQKLIYANPNCLKYLIEKWVNVDCSLEIRKMLHWISSYLTWDQIKISDESAKNLKTWLDLACKNNKKVIILSNHISHLDAPILDFILSNKLDMQWKDVRFVCWAFMYYNRWVRPYTIWFNTLFVYWPEDLKNVIERVWSKWRRLILDFDKKVKDTAVENKNSEILVLFPYAWRAKQWKDINYKYWCKDKMPSWIKWMVSNEECLYIPIWFDWTNNIFWKENTWWGWNMLKNFTNIKQTPITISIWGCFIWWEKELQEISDTILQESIKAYNENHK